MSQSLPTPPARPLEVERIDDARVEIVERTNPFQGYFRIDRYRLRHRKFDGGWSEVQQREVFERGHAAAVLPYDPARDSVVLIEQFRVGALAAGRDPWLIEIVAGIIDEGEATEEVARREAIEEAGCAVTDLHPIGSYLLSPGACTESLALYCGRTDSAGLAGGIHGLDHEGEDIRVLVLPLAEALALVEDGQVGNISAVTALQWLALNRDRVRALWGA